MSFHNFTVFSAEILDLSGESIAEEYLSSPKGPSGAFPDAANFFFYIFVFCKAPVAVL